jgi:hypothetical protein
MATPHQQEILYSDLELLKRIHDKNCEVLANSYAKYHEKHKKYKELKAQKKEKNT